MGTGHWVAGVGAPGQWAPREPTPHGAPSIRGSDRREVVEGVPVGLRDVDTLHASGEDEALGPLSDGEGEIRVIEDVIGCVGEHEAWADGREQHAS